MKASMETVLAEAVAWATHHLRPDGKGNIECTECRMSMAVLAMKPVVDAAREWAAVNSGMHTNGPQHVTAMRDTRARLLAALDALTGKDAGK